MLLNILILVVAALLAVLFGVLFWRARRFKPGLIKTGGLIVGGMGAVGFVVLTAFFGRGLYTLYAPQPISEISIPVTASVAQVERGEHLAESLCAACHTTNGELPLSGGINMSDDVNMPLGDLYAPNLTPGGRLDELSDADIWRLFREGVLPDGRRTVMPIAALSNLSDEDLQAIIAYLRTQPAVEHTTPAYNPSPLMAIAVGSGMVPMKNPPITEAVTAPAKDTTVEYGEYVASYSDCVACHGANLDGKVSPPFPAGPDLRVVKGWSAEMFINTMRTGVNPAGKEIQPPMPWRSYGKMDDVELTALWMYLQDLP